MAKIYGFHYIYIGQCCSRSNYQNLYNTGREIYVEHHHRDAITKIQSMGITKNHNIQFLQQHSNKIARRGKERMSKIEEEYVDLKRQCQEHDKDAPLSSLLFNTVQEILPNTLRQEKEIKVYRLGRKNKNCSSKQMT